jgi:hypothetical protein
MTRNSLLEVIDSIFILNTGADADEGVGAGAGADVDNEETKEKKMKYVIDPELSYDRLNDLIAETRKIILNMYVNCEKNFIYTLKILQAIIEAQIFETSQRQMKELERSIDEEYAS